MKKANRAGQTVSFSALPSKTNVRSNSSNSQNAVENKNRLTTRVKFKEKLEGNVKGSQSVQFVRNSERSVKTAPSVVSFTPGLKSRGSSTAVSETVLPSGSVEESVNHLENINMSSPDLCTSLKIADRLLKSITPDCNGEEGKIDAKNLHSSKNLMAKVLKKVNIPFEEQIYKDLVDLKVTEDDLFVEQGKKLKSKNFKRIKDNEPELSAFYKPSFDQEFMLKVERFKIEPENLVHYNGFSLSDRHYQYFEKSLNS